MRPRSLGSRHYPRQSGGDERRKFILDFYGQIVGEDAIGHAAEVVAWHWPEVWAGPETSVGLGQDDPRAFAVQPKALLGLRGDFDRRGVV